MALLQISEPGESPDPHQHRRAVGIDLGTTHSLAATVRSGSAEVSVANRSGAAAKKLRSNSSVIYGRAIGPFTMTFPWYTSHGVAYASSAFPTAATTTASLLTA